MTYTGIILGAGIISDPAYGDPKVLRTGNPWRIVSDRPDRLKISASHNYPF